MKKLSSILWKKAQCLLIQHILKGSFWAAKVLFFLAQYKDLNTETVQALVKLWLSDKMNIPCEKCSVVDKIFSAHKYHYFNSRKTEADLMEYLGRDLLLAAKTRQAIYSLNRITL